ncbi:uncharacterized protein LOC124190232 [Daphnia pulex]|uniref:uncharacterized protein LOC124190232 n=1 Tax=Daphnia pulex TaxID=6669 RepID=UPI001EDF8F85|nr:uncharacterized protein LOC124190232 [Daphnia pulex]
MENDSGSCCAECISDSPFVEPLPEWIEFLDASRNRPHRDKQILCKLVMLDAVPVVTKSVSIDFDSQTFTRYFMSNMYVGGNNPSTFSNKVQLLQLYSEFENQRQCPGLPDLKYRQVGAMKTGIFSDGTWRSKKCLYLEDNKEACRSCNDFRKTLNQRIRREALRAKQMKNNSKKVSKENYCYLSPTEIKLKLKRQRQQMFLQKQKISRQRLKLQEYAEKVKFRREKVAMIEQQAIRNYLNKLSPEVHANLIDSSNSHIGFEKVIVFSLQTKRPHPRLF